MRSSATSDSGLTFLLMAISLILARKLALKTFEWMFGLEVSYWKYCSVTLLFLS